MFRDMVMPFGTINPEAPDDLGSEPEHKVAESGSIPLPATGNSLFLIGSASYTTSYSKVLAPVGTYSIQVAALLITLTVLKW